jgi:putative DNA primase/helicase
VKRWLAQGIGYEFDGGDLHGIDLDHVIDTAGTLAPQAQEIVGKLNSYTEISPSKTGLHIFVLAPGAHIKRHRKKGCFLEIYNERRYFTDTGNIYGNAKAIETRTSELQAIHEKFLLPEITQNLAHLPPLSSTQSANQERFLHIGLKRDKAFAALWAGERHNNNESADDIALMNKLAYWCNADPDAMIRAFYPAPTTHKKTKPTKRNASAPITCQTQPITPAPMSIQQQ